MTKEENEQIYGECFLCGHHGETENICRVDGTHLTCAKKGCPWKYYPWADADKNNGK